MGTFKQLATNQRFIGLSTETKPTAGVNYGAEWYQVNAVTKKIDKVYTYVADDGTGAAGWVETAGLNFDANLQVGSADVSNSNPVPISDSGGSVTVDVGTALPAGTAVVGKVGIDQTTDGTTNKVQARNATHGDFQVNATVQLADTDVSATNPVPVKSVQTIVSATVTRPADTNAYAANDVLSNSTSSPAILSFLGVASANGGKGQVTGGTMVIDAASTPSIRLLLFDGAAPTAINDNAAFAPSDADAAKCIGWLDFDTYQAGSGNTIYQDFTKLIQFECDGAVDDIYAIPVVQGAFTPASGSLYTFSLNITRS